MNRHTTLDVWSDICRSLFPKPSKGETVHPLHSCIIGGKRHYIHSPQLKAKDPLYFKRLCAFAEKHGVTLKADRRAPNEGTAQGRRKKFLPIMFLALGVNSYACETPSEHSLHLFSQDHPMNTAHSAQKHEHSETQMAPDLKPDKALAEHILSILKTHFVAQKDEPEYLSKDLELLANYYSTHPEAVSLIESIADKPWSLTYAPHTFQTDISGNRLDIEDVTVYFDPRSGAQLKFYDRCDEKAPFCIASPADALLHELLHVHTVVNETTKFIADGGLNLQIYPVEHERKTIAKENVLYKSMSRRDNHPRPIRSDHAGRHVLVSCVTCVN